MATEIERKFIVDELPPRDVLAAGIRIRQGYLALDGDVELRVRIADGDANLTVKVGSGLRRIEVEAPISAEEAEALWPHTSGRRIDKVRHRVGVGLQLVADVDVYEGDLAGLVVVEVEFHSDISSAGFDPPAWFGREVTGQAEWSNAQLAQHGRPATP